LRLLRTIGTGAPSLDRMDNFLMNLGFTKSKADPNLYYKVEDGILVILLLYDDLFLIEK
jgi:hypothetical protein